ncbi:hypothetical protein [Bacillus cereus group sp. BfR-BA-01328]|uniref:hypothetical protein n=1 Tax=Bacillus cereus group sp. BfR-BA-01328 TaxID=2920304 RepID=UPI001F57F6FF
MNEAIDGKKMYENLIKIGYKSVGVHDDNEVLSKEFSDGIFILFAFKNEECIGTMILSEEQLRAMQNLKQNTMDEV